MVLLCNSQLRQYSKILEFSLRVNKILIILRLLQHYGSYTIATQLKRTYVSGGHGPLAFGELQKTLRSYYLGMIFFVTANSNCV